MRVTVVGGGMAGSEAAWQLAEAGLDVSLVEMKPAAMSPAHQSPLLGELVCSNSLRSDDPIAPAGLLKQELRKCGSLVIACADQHRVPAGTALAVERFGFARAITQKLALHRRIRIERRRLEELPDGPTIVCTGPLTEGALAQVIRAELGGDRMYFYDAIAPIVAADSIDHELAFRASRWDRNSDGAEGGDVGVGDYVNCPMNKQEYEAFVAAVNAGRKVLPHDFEEPRYFESCMPIEVMAERGDQTLRFGPMRPIGLTDPRTGRRPWAVVQLRPENKYLTAYNLVGFQTRLAYPEQQRIFQMIPALHRAEFLRFGSIHRNTYIDAPSRLGARFELLSRPSIHFAGLLTGVEGYIESCAMGLVVAWLLAEKIAAPPPATTMLGGLYQHVTAPREASYKYGPTNVNYGLLPPLEGTRKDNRKERMAERARVDLEAWLTCRDMTRFALITGGSSGIGAAVAKALAAQGYAAVAAARRFTGKPLALSMGQVTEAHLDVTDADAVRGLIGALPPLDVLVMSAGVGTFAPVVDAKPEDLRAMLEVHVVGTLLCAQAALPAMVARGKGHIIAIGSHAAHRAFPECSAYTAAKAGQLGLMRVLAEEARPHGVRVVNLLAGATDTPIWDDRPGFDRDKMMKPEDVARFLLALLDPKIAVEEVTVTPPAGAL